jgi:hypothetical protein
MQVGEPLNGIGQRLLVDLGVLGVDAVADGAVGGGGERQLVHQFTPLGWAGRRGLRTGPRARLAVLFPARGGAGRVRRRHDGPSVGIADEEIFRPGQRFVAFPFTVESVMI